MRRWIAEYVAQIDRAVPTSYRARVLRAALAWYRRVRGAVERSDSRLVARAYLRWKHGERMTTGWRYTFVTLAELLAWTEEWSRSFPTTYDVIVGIPRSGLLVAGILALKLGKPLTTTDLFLEGRRWESKQMTGAGAPRRVLLVDDSISNGETFRANLAKVRRAGPDYEVTTGAVIVTPEMRGLVDLHYVVIPQPRLFEWNMLHAKPGRLVTDLDGVLCENCPPGVDVDEATYAAWIEGARPYLIPAFEIDAIVSSRLVRYREATEAWLARHGVRYRELYLWEIGSKEEARGRHGRHKIEKLVLIKPEMVWESNRFQAEEIWRATRIPTLCIDEMRLFT